MISERKLTTDQRAFLATLADLMREQTGEHKHVSANIHDLPVDAYDELSWDTKSGGQSTWKTIDFPGLGAISRINVFRS